MSKNRKIGDFGEQLALNYLKENGFEVIQTNWTVGHKEIDIIALENGIYIFIEVKTRTNLKMGMPENAISEKKIKNITEAALHFLINKNYVDIRFDVISVVLLRNKNPEILHIKDAFY